MRVSRVGMTGYGVVAVLSLSTFHFPLSIAADPATLITHDIPSSKENPRNSEGAFVTLQDGSILFAYTHFYGGGGDFASARLAAIRSSDGGRTWSAPETVIEKGKHLNVMSVSFVPRKDGKPALVYLVKDGTDQCHPVLRVGAGDGKSWSDPSPVIEEPGYFVLNNDRVVRLKSGRLVLPVALHPPTPPHPTKKGGIDYRAAARWYLSDDDGKTWREAKTRREMTGETRAGLQEPGVVERADGTLWCFARTDRGSQYGMESTDGGETWSEPAPTSLKSPLAPASVKRIPGTNDLLAVWCDRPSGEPVTTGHGGRTPLVAAVSKDGGRTWPVRRVLEDDPDGAFCYTAIHFADDAVLLAYSAGTSKDWGLAAQRIRRVPLAWLRRGDPPVDHEDSKARRDTK